MMSKPIDISATVANLNRTVHEPARLAILTVLSACDSADFVFLRAATGLTAGNLSVQIARLEEAGMVTVEKIMERRRTVTIVALTSGGRGELETYWRAMERMRHTVRVGDAAPPDAIGKHPGVPVRARG